MNKEFITRNDPLNEIEKSRKKEIRVQVSNSINLINNNSSEIKSLINQNDELKKEIQKLKKINETTTNEISSIENQINNNSSEIKSLINQNEDLIKEIDENS